MLKAEVSRRLSANLLERQNQATVNGKLPSLSLPVWNALPQSTRKWLHRRVFKPSEDCAWQRLQADPELSDFYNPAPNTFAIGPATIAFIWRLLHEIRPHRILEFGGGTSTRLCARYAQEMATSGRCVKIVSVDHDAHWLNDTRSRIVAEGHEAFVDFVHAPLGEQQLLGRPMMAYTLPPNCLTEYHGPTGFNLCLVDGPSGRIGRSGALAIAAPHLADHCTLLLDDAFRDGEQQTVQEWKRAFPTNFTAPKLLLSDSHGLVSAQWRLK